MNKTQIEERDVKISVIRFQSVVKTRNVQVHDARKAVSNNLLETTTVCLLYSFRTSSAILLLQTNKQTRIHKINNQHVVISAMYFH